MVSQTAVQTRLPIVIVALLPQGLHVAVAVTVAVAVVLVPHQLVAVPPLGLQVVLERRADAQVAEGHGRQRQEEPGHRQPRHPSLRAQTCIDSK